MSSDQGVHLARSTTDLLRDAEVALLNALEECRCPYHEDVDVDCSHCLRIERVRRDAGGALTWLLKRLTLALEIERVRAEIAATPKH